MKPVQKLSLAVAGMALGLVATAAKPAQAATLSYNFQADIAGTTGNGSFSFDDATLTEFGAPVTALNFSLGGFSYTNADDTNGGATAFQTALFTGGGAPIGLNFAFLNKATGAATTIIGDAVLDGGFNQVGGVSYSAVPEPATLAGILAIGGLGLLSRKRKADEENA